jgi:fructose-1-phosphate kinase PfkB-like protein
VRYHFDRGDGAPACCNIRTKHANARAILVGGSLPKGVSDSALAVLMKSVHLDQLYAALYAAAHSSA